MLLRFNFLCFFRLCWWLIPVVYLPCVFCMFLFCYHGFLVIRGLRFGFIFLVLVFMCDLGCLWIDRFPFRGVSPSLRFAPPYHGLISRVPFMIGIGPRRCLWICIVFHVLVFKFRFLCDVRRYLSFPSYSCWPNSTAESTGVFTDDFCALGALWEGNYRVILVMSSYQH